VYQKAISFAPPRTIEKKWLSDTPGATTPGGETNVDGDMDYCSDVTASTAPSERTYAERKKEALMILGPMIHSA
jgi:hypothetical protein